MKTSNPIFYLGLLVCALLPPDLSAQCWIDFTDETGTRLVLSSVPATDGEEKDLASADLDKDGWTDLVIVRKTPFSSPGAQADLLLMNEGGILTDRTSLYAPEFISGPSDSRDVHIVDLDADGWKDVVIISTFEDQPKYYRNRGDSSGVWLGLVDESSTRFPTITVSPLQFCAGWSGDLTGDGHPELYFVNYNPSGACDDVLLVNDGSGNFTDETAARMNGLEVSAFGTGVEIHDADSDGDMDIIKNSANPDGSVGPWFGSGVYIIYNDGTGNFSTWQQMPSDASYMFTSGDLDGDNDIDHYVVDDNQDYVNIAGAATPDLNVNFTKNTLSFSPRTTGFGGNCKLVDLDNDGDLDLGIASVDVDIPPCENSRKLDLLQNDGSGDLSSVFGTDDQNWTASNHDMEFMDIDNDGKLDMVVGLCDAYAVYIQADLLSLTAAATGTSTAGASDGSVDLTTGSGSGPYTYSWSNGATTEDLTGVPAGLYSCSVVDANGCSDWIEVTVEDGVGSPCTTAPSGLNAVVAGDVTISWNSLASTGVQAYRVRGRVLGTSTWKFLPGAIFEPATSAVVSSSILSPGATYEYEVIGSCVPLGTVLTPFSATAQFSVPSPRTAPELIASTNEMLEILHPGTGPRDLIRVLDLTGRVQKTQLIPEGEFPATIRIDISGLPAGFYLLDTGQGHAIPFTRI